MNRDGSSGSADTPVESSRSRRHISVWPVVVARLAGDLAGWRRWAFLASFASALVFVLGFHGFLPRMSQIPLTSLMGEGAIQCLHDQGIASLWTWCMSIGLPVGAPRLTGLPQIYAGWLLTYVPGVDAWTAHQITSAVLVAVAVVAGFALMRRWGAPRWIALMFAVSYAIALNIVPLNGFEYTFLGYILLPAYVWMALWVLDRIDEGAWGRAAGVSFVLCLYMAFTDGYSFIGAAVVIGCMLVTWGLRAGRGQWQRSASGVALWLSALVSAALLYVAWTPASAFETGSGLETFAQFGVDLVTLVVPPTTTLVPDLLQLPVPRLDLWGVTQTIEYNFLGYLGPALVCVLLVALARRRRSIRAHAESGVGAEGVGASTRQQDAREPGDATRTATELYAVGAAGLITLVLSLGPVLKIGQTEPDMTAALMTLPTAWIHENVPGFSEMRAVHRWLVVTR